MHEMNKQRAGSGAHANRHGRSDKQSIERVPLCSLHIYLKDPSEKENDLISEEQLLVYAYSYLHYVNILWHVDSNDAHEENLE